MLQKLPSASLPGRPPQAFMVPLFANCSRTPNQLLRGRLRPQYRKTAIPQHPQLLLPPPTLNIPAPKFPGLRPQSPRLYCPPSANCSRTFTQAPASCSGRNTAIPQYRKTVPPRTRFRPILPRFSIPAPVYSRKPLSSALEALVCGLVVIYFSS